MHMYVHPHTLYIRVYLHNIVIQTLPVLSVTIHTYVHTYVCTYLCTYTGVVSPKLQQCMDFLSKTISSGAAKVSLDEIFNAISSSVHMYVHTQVSMLHM